ncbi:MULTISPECIES: xanthine dehydrogenase small subunit [Vibrio]|uniref:Xanthine dehydrogenase small subunit n=1 Tax=Vibrio mediterranei TaxID=689 RepID=A0ABX5D7S5_9VIBR|nr:MULTISPECIES: xanthine dehydrogenase small subunit [Vibrio]EDL54369.1 putative xanthine dehydrogenase, XdhA subunit [Vibrio mediterranei AK1]NUW72247.1 xanthine dehydrogenase small subunit [Vibrio mediterranei]PCD89718.1 xanthine dehydrogenase small subunit [Vibrio mediterranei]PRQ65063.1 xanthine dehydrogenase small subunit [Vibrio mediterranei]PTC04626.1 xanthine dehydrogenase small subunit [Vibrio mediterranei]
MITFLLNQEIKQEVNVSPNMTVLNYLRTHVKKTGTKEGCGSGDCGACTVVLGELVDGQLKYRSVNSCLTFISALHGKQLITVEDLQEKGQSLHPVQEAIVEFHGSQCGYCTPGFIMSMFALTKNKPNASKPDVMESLAGNLCRCTGYRPIVDSALSLCSEERIVDQFSELERATIQKLESIQDEDASLRLGHLTAFSPKTTDELAKLYKAHPQAKLVAGGTDLALEVTQFHREIETLISVNLVEEMKVCEETDQTLEIGANLPISDAYQLLTKHYPDFGELLHRFASLQVRNQGTIGGNIANASPIGDTPPLLIALDASIQLRCGDETRVIPVEEYFISYKVTAQQESEFIEKIIIPKPSNDSFRAYKLSKRLDDDISAVCGAFAITVEDNVVTDARVAFGGMAATPKRATLCEQALIGQAWNEETIATAMEAVKNDFEPLSDFRASQEYRTISAANMLKRYYIETNNTSNLIETRVTSYV